MRVTSADLTIASDGADYFGAALATGDISGDGLPDLIVGAPDYTDTSSAYHYADDPGQVYVFDAADLAAGPTLASDASTMVTATSDATTFGLTLTAGDLSDDGADELLVAAPTETSNYGRVYVFGR